jgi:hypothetical protein
MSISTAITSEEFEGFIEPVAEAVKDITEDIIEFVAATFTEVRDADNDEYDEGPLLP